MILDKILNFSVPVFPSAEIGANNLPHGIIVRRKCVSMRMVFRMAFGTWSGNKCQPSLCCGHVREGRETGFMEVAEAAH